MVAEPSEHRTRSVPVEDHTHALVARKKPGTPSAVTGSRESVTGRNMPETAGASKVHPVVILGLKTASQSGHAELGAERRPRRRVRRSSICDSRLEMRFFDHAELADRSVDRANEIASAGARPATARARENS